MDTDTPTSDTHWSSKDDAGHGQAGLVVAGSRAAAATDLDDGVGGGAGAPE